MLIRQKRSEIFLILFMLYFAFAGICTLSFAQEADRNFDKPNTAFHAKSSIQDSAGEESKKNSLTFGAFPIIFYMDETRLGFGAGGQAVKPGESEPSTSSVTLIAFYTQNKQYSFQVIPDIYFNSANYRYSGELSFNYFPNKFYGIGNKTKKDNEESYSTRNFSLNAIIQKKIVPNLYAGIQLVFINSKLSKLEKEKLLDSGDITGSRGGNILGLGINTAWDSRDNNLYPMDGSFFQFSAISYGKAIGSDFNFTSYMIDLRNYKMIFDNHVFAVQSVVRFKNGKPPFQIMAELGSYLRGYYQSRFIDKNLAVLQAEYRMPVYGRFGIVGFAGLGSVTHQLNNFSINELKYSSGFGIRFALIPEQKVNLRIDFGFGRGDSSFDIALNEMF